MLLANGRDCHSVIMDKIALGVVVALPSFPHAHALSKEIDGIPVFGTDEVADNLHCCQMRKGDITHLATSGDYCMVVTAAEVSKAKEVAYKRIKGIHIPGGITVRDDIGERLEEQIPRLQKHGYALGV
jgi:phosphoribosylamine-glycine ligase